MFFFTCSNFPSQARQKVLCRKLSDEWYRYSAGRRSHLISDELWILELSYDSIPESDMFHSFLLPIWPVTGFLLLVLLMALGRQALSQKWKQLGITIVKFNAISLYSVLELRDFAGKQSWLRTAIQMGK